METDDKQTIAALYEALDAIMSERWSPGGRSEAVSDDARAALALARGEHPESRVGLDPDAGTRQHGEK